MSTDEAAAATFDALSDDLVIRVMLRIVELWSRRERHEPHRSLARLCSAASRYRDLGAQHAPTVWAAAIGKRFPSGPRVRGPLRLVEALKPDNWMKRYALLCSRSDALDVERRIRPADASSGPGLEHASIDEVNAAFEFWLSLRMSNVAEGRQAELVVPLRMAPARDDARSFGFTNLAELSYPLTAWPCKLDLFVRRRADGAVAWMLAADLKPDYELQGRWNCIGFPTGTGWDIEPKDSCFGHLCFCLVLPKGKPADSDPNTSEWITITAAEERSGRWVSGGLNLRNFDWVEFVYDAEVMARGSDEEGSDDELMSPEDRCVEVAELGRILARSQAPCLRWL